MKYFIVLFGLILGNAHAAQVVTLDFPKTTLEFTLIATDETLYSLLDKNFMTRTCKPRTGSHSALFIRESFFPRACRAEVIQFLLNNHYKADYLFKTFTKD